MSPTMSRNRSSLSTILVSTQDGGTPDAKNPDLKVQPQPHKHFKLISVTLKEAALDSPSFRASVNHLDLQLLDTEKWLLALTSSLAKIPQEVKELRGFLSSFLEYLVPLFLQDGLLDQEYTVASLNNTKEGLQMLWNMALAITEVDMPHFEVIKDELVKKIASYKQLRKQFDAAQVKYDQFLSIFMALSKLKEAALVMEDLQQVFAVRRDYLHLSLELSMELSELSNLINERITLQNFALWSERMDKFSNNPVVTGLFSDFWTKTKRIRCWSDNYRRATHNLRSDLMLAKQHIEDRAVAQFTPSGVLNDYRPQLINARSLNDANEPSAEIHGYVFMKTWTEKSNKPIWVKRWAFVQGGVFGFLVLSPSKTSVQETDKIGVLLCSAKYSANEDRRLCFEVKSIDITITLQVETLSELESWLKVFDNARNRIINPEDPLNDLFSIASGRYPPLVTEFLSPINTLMDREITSSRIINSAGQIITSSKLSAHIEKNEKLFQSYIFNQIAHIDIPFVTDTSRSSLIAYSLTGSTAVPTALSANIWGSLNWGVYYMNDEDSYDAMGGGDIPDEEFTKQIGNGIMVPASYPDSWLARNIQFRALFESAVGPQECCLVSFNCLLAPNAQQELRGTAFFTQKNIYSYIHSLGFVSLSKASITPFVEAHCTKKKNYDLLKVISVQGSLRAKLYLEDGALVAKKLNCLFLNAASDKPASVSKLISQLSEIEVEYNAAKQKKEKILHENDAHAMVSNVSSFDFMIPSDSPLDKRFEVDFSDEMNLVGEYVVKLPPKALFHVLFGARSTVIEESYPVIKVKISDRGKWMKKPENDKYLYRELMSEFRFYGKKNGKIHVRQELEGIAENEYYCCKVTRSNFKMTYGPAFSFEARLVLIGIEGGMTKFRYYGRMFTETNSGVARLLRSMGGSYTQSFFGNICRKIDDAVTAIGHHGKIVKAIYLYGKIEVTESTYTMPEAQPSVIGIGTIIRLFSMGTMTSATRRLFASIYFVLSALKIILQSLSAQRILVAIIAFLSILNMYLGARTTQHYWNAREASGLAREAISFEPMIMERAIYIKDVHDLIRRDRLIASNSTCFKTFQNMSFVLNFDQPASWRSAYEDELTRNVATKLRKSLQEIGIRRNELLVNLRMLNVLEEEIARGEWKNWLVNELERCDHLKHLPIVEEPAVHNAEFESGLELLDKFCSSCSEEMDLILSNAHL